MQTSTEQHADEQQDKQTTGRVESEAQEGQSADADAVSRQTSERQKVGTGSTFTVNYVEFTDFLKVRSR